MKKLIILALVICLCPAILAIPAAAAEMRGIWVDAFHPGFKTPAETSAMVAKAKDCNFNALFVQVRKRGDVYYRSNIEPMAADIPFGYDPLADVIAKAHDAGLEVHAWITTYEVAHVDKWAAAYPNQVHARRPEWVCKDNRGKTIFPGDKVFLDPGVKEVQDYLVAVAGEIAAGYNVDGIHLDGIRYPLPETGYNDAALARFGKETARTDKPKVEDKQWNDWRCAQVTDLVAETCTVVTKTRPSIKVSASVYPDAEVAHNLCLQDWAGWLDAGILDFVVPMVFEGDNNQFAKTVADCLSAGKGKRHVYIGHAGWKLDTGDSMERMGSARRAGAPGTVVYSYWYCSQQGSGKGSDLMKALKAGPYEKPDAQPAMAWKPGK